MVVGVLTASLGLHLALLQCVAWSCMFSGFLRSGDPLPAALCKTFDGNHPCSLCAWVRSKATDASHDAASRQGQPNLPKLELAPPSREACWVPPASRLASIVSAPCFAPIRTVRPAVPPPRASRA